MWPFKKQIKRDIWTETMIRLYEKQMQAREAMGERYLHHPKHILTRPKLRVVK